MKDNFSSHASVYAQFRPVYPAELYDFLFSLIQHRELAWDCGCGNGQVAGMLADHFERVEATDISQKQLDQAVKKPNISYQLAPAEKVNIPANTVDLVTVAQAIHWFDFAKFYREVRRVGKPDALIAVWCYSLLTVNKEVDAIIQKLYADALGDKYWDPERHYVEEGYQTIPFPFDEITAPDFKIRVSWTPDHLIGYLNSWSAVQHYIRDNNSNPVEKISAELRDAWGAQDVQEVVFPLFARVGKI